MSTFLSVYIAPILWRYIVRSRRYVYYAIMRQRQYDSLEKNIEFQREKLFHIVEYAVLNIPYYRKIAKERSIKITKESIFSDIRKFPILTKEIIREQGILLCNPRIASVKNTSGGTTGEPVTFLQDKTSRDWGAAAKMFFYEWSGRQDGEYMVSLWGSERDIFQGSDGLRGLIVRYFTNVKLLNTFRMTPNQMESYWKEIEEKRPKLVLAYVQSAYELARYVEKKGKVISGTSALMTSAGNLYPTTRSFLEKIFQCRVFNRYGSREVGDVACTCEKQNELHLNIFNHFVEVLDNNGNDIDDSIKTGNIHITTLNNYAMPLLRYSIGDIATGIDMTNTCVCGRGLPRLRRLAGRDVEVFSLADGTMVDGEFFTHLFYHKTWVKKFQIIQESFSLVRVRIVKIGTLDTQLDEEEITQAILIVMGEQCDVVWDFVPEIEPLPSGKFLYTINRTKMI